MTYRPHINLAPRFNVKIYIVINYNSEILLSTVAINNTLITFISNTYKICNVLKM